MNDPMLKSVNSIKEVSLGMIHNIRAIKGPAFANVAHTALLIESLDHMLDSFTESVDEPDKELAGQMYKAGSQMLAQVMTYMINSSGLSREQVTEAFKEAQRIQEYSLQMLNKAAELSEQGKAMGD